MFLIIGTFGESISLLCWCISKLPTDRSLIVLNLTVEVNVVIIVNECQYIFMQKEVSKLYLENPFVKSFSVI